MNGGDQAAFAKLCTVNPYSVDFCIRDKLSTPYLNLSVSMADLHANPYW
jgi:hypothetical protein